MNASVRFEALYRSTRTDLLAYLIRRTASPEEAADLHAETYLVAWEQHDRLPAGAEARLYLFGVARNLCRQGVRRSRVASALVDRLAGDLRSVSTGPPEPRDEALWAALGELGSEDREVILLTAWEGLTPREIAVVLGTSANAVRIRLHRARRRLIKQCGGSEEVRPASRQSCWNCPSA
jgi:RNA polymerase sigma factor (sigma-70 family)